MKTTDDRLVGIAAAFLAVLGLLWLRCFWLQVVQAPTLARVAILQHRVSQSIVAQRGVIYDRVGRVLAMSVRTPSVFANPHLVTTADQTASDLADVLDRDPQLLKTRLSQRRGFVWLARHVDHDLTEDLRPFRRAGIGVVEESARVYPGARMAAHLLGFVDIDEKGLEGLEQKFNGVLRGRSGWLATLRDAKGDRLVGPWTVDLEPEAGFDVVLTIDSVVQQAAQEALGWGVQQFHAKGGSLIVMDPHTGEILALANQPDFDPNHPGGAGADARRDRAITDLMEPGSVFKIVTASALLEEKLVRPDERIFCEEGAFPTVARHVLHDAHAHGWLTFQEVITYSSNIGTAKAAQRLSPETLYRYVRAFGFGQKTAVDLPGEVSGIVPPPSKWSKLSPFVIPIGQEVAVTPMQLAVMTAVVANGGWKVRPHVVDRIQAPSGKLLRTFPSSRRTRILSPETVAQLGTMLISVVEKGTGHPANIQGLTVAGKTGTAQKLEPTGRYSHSRYVASFVGYGPVPDPRFVIVVTLDEPHPVYFGGLVAAPIFRRTVEPLLSYWGVRKSAEPRLVAKLP